MLNWWLWSTLCCLNHRCTRQECKDNREQDIYESWILIQVNTLTGTGITTSGREFTNYTITKIKSTSGASLQPLTLVLVRPLTSIEWPFPHAHFCLKSECRTPLPIIVTSQSFAKPNPTVQRMTSYYKNWLAWGFWQSPVHHLDLDLGPGLVQLVYLRRV